MLTVAACQYPDLNITQLYSGPCKNRDCTKIVCPPNPARVLTCGSDGKQYENDCELEVAQCKEPNLRPAFNGPCNCDDYNCTDEAAPVCASDGSVYGNGCHFQKKYCELYKVSSYITPVQCSTQFQNLPATSKAAPAATRTPGPASNTKSTLATGLVANGGVPSSTLWGSTSTVAGVMAAGLGVFFVALFGLM
ncbi:hypothetical protein HDU67_000470 [Dinochytrium kinnereticum]|nr:hypothetical protein HDU67_000470 [Dinochytrium kinnereticum]